MIRFVLNGEEHTVDASVVPSTTMLDYLRDRLRRTGTKEGCAEGAIGWSDTSSATAAVSKASKSSLCSECWSTPSARFSAGFVLIIAHFRCTTSS